MLDYAASRSRGWLLWSLLWSLWLTIEWIDYLEGRQPEGLYGLLWLLAVVGGGSCGCGESGCVGSCWILSSDWSIWKVERVDGLQGLYGLRGCWWLVWAIVALWAACGLLRGS